MLVSKSNLIVFHTNDRTGSNEESLDVHIKDHKLQQKNRLNTIFFHKLNKRHVFKLKR